MFTHITQKNQRFYTLIVILQFSQEYIQKFLKRQNKLYKMGRAKKNSAIQTIQNEENTGSHDRLNLRMRAITKGLLGRFLTLTQPRLTALLRREFQRSEP